LIVGEYGVVESIETRNSFPNWASRLVAVSTNALYGDERAPAALQPASGSAMHGPN
jgi:hypothetical protein